MEMDAEPWWKLFHRDRPVGFKKNAGRFSFFSTDGDVWNGTPRHVDLAVRELPIRDHDNHRLFEGDVIAGCWMGRQDTYLVTQDRKGNCFIGTTAGALQDVSVAETRRDLFVQRNLGNIFVDAGLKADFDRAIRKLQTRGRHFVFDKIFMSATVSGTVLLTCALQLRLLGAIGPLLTIIGLLSGVLIYLAARNRFAKNWMTRGAVFAITPVVSIAVGTTLSLLFWWLMPSSVQDTRQPFWIAATLAATLFLLCFGCIPITAQLLGFHKLQPVHQDRT